MTRPPISALIITYNEADQVEDCVRSVEWADEVYLVDSFSTDGTVEIVREKFPRVTVDQHEYFGAGAQRNYALDRLTNDWVLAVDADERVTPELRAEVERTLEDPRLWAYEIGRRNFVYGREVKYGGLQRDRVTRLFHRRHARYQNRRVHAELNVDGAKGRLQHKFLHYYIRSFDHMIEKMTRYGMWGAANHFRNGRRGSWWQIAAHPTARFLRDYVFWRGFLDGAPGFIVTGLHVYYTFWKYAKLWEFTKLEQMGKSVPLPPFDTNEDRWTQPWEVGDPEESSPEPR
jgi:glycosyltransferase involved in cell wall biosynthesis